MDFTNHPLNKQSIIDNRQSKKLSKSIIDYHTERLRTRFNDPNLGEGMVVLALTKLGEGQINSMADYVLRKSDHPGKAFVRLCDKLLKEKQ